jgi:hypothetical protein
VCAAPLVVAASLTCSARARGEHSVA